MANRWLGDHPLYPNVESLVLHIIEDFDDAARGVTFNEIYEIVDEYQPSSSSDKAFQPSRNQIKSILDDLERYGSIVEDRNKYYLNYDHTEHG